MAKATQKFEDAVNEWLKSCQQMIADYWVKQGYKYSSPPTLTVAKGSKNWKIVEVQGSGGRCVFAFIDIETGDILKPASWRAPAQHARGNLWDDTKGMGRMTVYGPEYLK